MRLPSKIFSLHSNHSGTGILGVARVNFRQEIIIESNVPLGHRDIRRCSSEFSSENYYREQRTTRAKENMGTSSVALDKNLTTFDSLGQRVPVSPGCSELKNHISYRSRYGLNRHYANIKRDGVHHKRNPQKMKKIGTVTKFEKCSICIATTTWQSRKSTAVRCSCN